MSVHAKHTAKMTENRPSVYVSEGVELGQVRFYVLVPEGLSRVRSSEVLFAVPDGSSEVLCAAT